MFCLLDEGDKDEESSGAAMFHTVETKLAISFSDAFDVRSKFVREPAMLDDTRDDIVEQDFMLG